MDPVKELKCLLSAHWQIQIDQHPAVILALQLKTRIIQLQIQRIECIFQIIIQLDVSVLHHVVQIHDHIDNRNFIISQVIHNLTVVFLSGSICRIQRLRRTVIQIDQFRKFSRIQPIGQCVSVHDLDIGKAHGRTHLITVFQIFQKRRLRLIIAARHNDRDQIPAAKGVFYGLPGNRHIIFLNCRNSFCAIDIRAPVGKQKCSDQKHCKHRRDHISALYSKFSHCSDFRHEIFMVSPVDPFAEHHQQPGHQRENREQTVENRLDQADSHIKTDMKLHEHHRCQSANCRQTAGDNLRDSFAECDHCRIVGIIMLSFLRIPMDQNHCIINRQRQLEHNGYRIGNERNRAEYKIGAHIQ